MNPSGHNPPNDPATALLNGLRTAEIPAGMEARILQAIEHSTNALPKRQMPRSLISRVWFRRPEFAFSLAAVALFALALGLRTTYRHRSNSQPAPTGTLHNPLQRGTTPPPQTKLPHREIVPSPSNTGLTHPQFAASYPAPRSAAQPQSFPAPEAPLTTQERLLLQIIHQGDPQEIAALNPTLRAAETAEDIAEFEEFFKPKTAIPPAPDPATRNPAPAGPATINPSPIEFGPINQGDPHEPARR